MRVHRIARRQWVNDLSGKGAERAGGRWNPRGKCVVYTSESSSLAMLESLVRYDMDLIPRDLYMAAIEIPADAVEDLPAHQLPAGWRNVPPPPILQQVGLRWLNRGQALCLRVPSAVNPHEFNVLINPVHPHFQEVKVVSTWSLTWDERFQPRP